MTFEEMKKYMFVTYVVCLIVEIVSFSAFEYFNPFMSTLKFHDWMLVIALGLFVPFIFTVVSFGSPTQNQIIVKK